MQTLFTNDDAEVAGRLQRRWCVTAGCYAMMAVSFLLSPRVHDTPLGVVFLLAAVASVLWGLKLVPEKLLAIFLAACFAAAGIVDIKMGRSFGWLCCAWAVVCSVAFGLRKLKTAPTT